MTYLFDDTEELDSDGYPTEAALQKIREFKPTTRQDWHKLFDYIRALWIYADYFNSQNIVDETRNEPAHEYRISTAGWSGHEDVIGALQDNTFFWLDCWYSSKRGGHHIFRTEPK